MIVKKDVIRIKLSKENESVRVDVSDNGRGIRKENLEMVFERFWQDKRITKGKFTGSGLGLAIARQIVEHHMGKIWVESQTGVGTTFSFTLPVKRKE